MSDDVHDHGCARVADASQDARGHCLRAVEHLKRAGDGEQADAGVDHLRVVREYP